MKRRHLLQGGVMGGVAAVVLACVQIHPPTQCQLYVPDTKWSNAGIQVVLQAPSNRNCPLSLPYFRYDQEYLARISTPYGTPALKPLGTPQVDTRIWDANGAAAGVSAGYFGVGSDGREYANDEGFYFAGQAGPTTRLQQDQADTYIDLSPIAGGGTAANTVFLPYTCCQAQTLVAALPKTKRGSTVTIRTWSNFTFPKYAWYLNGGQILEKPCITCNPVSPGAVYSRAMNTAGTFTWKILISGTYPGQSKTLQFNMVVQ